MNGTFDLNLTHRLDEDLVKLGFKTANPVAVELTKICVETGKSPEEVLEVYKRVLKGLME